MATAFRDKPKAEQLGSGRAHSGVQSESICARCGGLMVADFNMDLIFCIGETEFAAQRCVQCGEVVDPVILHNRQHRQEPQKGQYVGIRCHAIR